ncbi:MAG: alkaline phosphatase family protein, partial [Bryobacteraceae bacterium]
PALVLSPYTRRGVIDSTMYNTTSVLRTMELILGLRPMTHFDAGATPMYSAFGSQPDLAPYDVEKPRVSLTERNPENGAAADASRHMDFEDADLNDDDALNDVLWRAIRKTAPPAPSRSINSRASVGQ